MMGQVERSYYIECGILWEEVENDGHAFLRRGAERQRRALCSVEQAKTLYPEELKMADIVDYALPMMTVKKWLNEVHAAVLNNDLEAALNHAFVAVAECRLLAVTLKDMKERDDALRQQTKTV
jgi:hypothetical protein